MGDYKGASSGPDTYPFMKAFILSRAGRYRDAESVLSRELKLAQTEGAPERVAGVHFLMAIFAIEQRALELALNQAAMAEESLASLPPSRKRRYLVVGDMLGGIAELRLGHIDRAKSRFDLLTKRYAADHQAERWWRSVLQAEIALASGDGRQAIRLYEDAEAEKTVKISMFPTVTWIMFHTMSEDDVRTVMKQPWVAIASDGSAINLEEEGVPHPRNYSTNARVLGHYVRDQKVLTLEDAVRKMTSLPAQILGLQDRGQIRQGFAADITVFDPVKVHETNSFESTKSYPEGIPYTIVNGIVVIDGGKHTGARPGKALMGHGYVPLPTATSGSASK